MSSGALAFDVSDDPKVFIDLHVTSVHSQANYYLDVGDRTEETPFNKNNGGIGLRYQVEDFLDVTAGFYKNSFYNTSVYLGGEIHSSRKSFVSVGLAAALITGYIGTPTSTPVIALPIVQIGVPQVGIRVGYMPFGIARFATFSLYVGF